jgi:hypothetical protein
MLVSIQAGEGMVRKRDFGLIRDSSFEKSLADACAERWEKEYYPMLRDDLPGLGGALLARGQAIVLRLALMYFLFDRPTQAQAEGRESEPAIRLEHLEAAMAVWDYCTRSVETIFGSKSTSGSILGDKVLNLLLDGPQTKTQLRERLSNRQRAGLGGVLLHLQDRKLVQAVELEHEGKGRAPIAWMLME